MQTHVKVLGVIYLAFGALMLLAALFLAVTLGGVAGIVGATAEPDDAAIAIPVLGFAGTALAGFLGIFSLPSLITMPPRMAGSTWASIVTSRPARFLSCALSASIWSSLSGWALVTSALISPR